MLLDTDSREVDKLLREMEGVRQAGGVRGWVGGEVSCATRVSPPLPTLVVRGCLAGVAGGEIECNGTMSGSPLAAPVVVADSVWLLFDSGQRGGAASGCTGNTIGWLGKAAGLYRSEAHVGSSSWEQRGGGVRLCWVGSEAGTHVLCRWQPVV